MNRDITDELEKKLRELDTSVRMLRDTGSEYAQSERDYKVELSKEALKLKDSGMAVTMINLVVYGSGKVPDLRLQRDIKKTIYDANTNAINSLKLHIRVIENQIEREWGQANRT